LFTKSSAFVPHLIRENLEIFCCLCFLFLEICEEEEKHIHRGLSAFFAELI